MAHRALFDVEVFCASVLVPQVPKKGKLHVNFG